MKIRTGRCEDVGTPLYKIKAGVPLHVPYKGITGYDRDGDILIVLSICSTYMPKNAHKWTDKKYPVANLRTGDVSWLDGNKCFVTADEVEVCVP